MTNNAHKKSGKKVAIQSRAASEENELPLSQESMTSSDAGIMAAVAQQMQASKEKKKKEKSRAFLHGAEKELNNCLRKSREAFTHDVQEMITLYEDFIMSYATAEDDIRKLLVLIREEQKTLLDLAITRHNLANSQSEEVEKGQLNGMANVKRACKDFKTIVDGLNPPRSVF